MAPQTTIVEELTRIAEQNGGILRPKDIVEAARPEESPLHPHFNWDDTDAAEKYRLWQARQLTRVLVTYESTDHDKRVPCRVFVSLTPDRDASGYRVMSAVMSDPEQRRQLLADAYAEMRRFRVKYQQLTELAKVFEAIDEVQDALPMEEPVPSEATA